MHAFTRVHARAYDNYRLRLHIDNITTGSVYTNPYGANVLKNKDLGLTNDSIAQREILRVKCMWAPPSEYNRTIRERRRRCGLFLLELVEHLAHR